MKEKNSGAAREKDRSTERALEDVRVGFSRTSQVLLDKSGSDMEVRRAKGEPYGLKLRSIPPREPSPESPKLDELRVDAMESLSFSVMPSTEEAADLLKRGLIAMAWEGVVGLHLDEICQVLHSRERTKTRDEWINKAVQSLKAEIPVARKFSKDELLASVAMIVDGTIAAYKRHRV